MFPGCFYLIGMWYKREEAQRRYSFFFSSTTLAGAFGALLASAIGKMQGTCCIPSLLYLRLWIDQILLWHWHFKANFLQV